MKKTILPVLALLALVSCESLVSDAVEEVKMGAATYQPIKSAQPSENLLDDGCPKAEIVRDLGSSTVYNGAPAPETIASYVQITSIESKCTWAPQSVTVDVRLTLDGKAGPAGGGSISVPYFVAVTSMGGSIMAKQVFSASMNLGAGSHQETLRQIIPIPNRATAATYRVLAGLQITPEQLTYNRETIKRNDQAKRDAEKAAREAAEAAEEARLKAAEAAEKAAKIPATPAPMDQPVPLAPAGH